MKKAFTIIELIVVIVILGITAGLGAEIIKFSFDNKQRTKTLNELELTAQSTIDFLSAHLNESVRNSLRLKKAENSDCSNNITDCKFVFNIFAPEELGNNYNIFEWARVASIERKKDLWSGVLLTRKVINDALNKPDCYKEIGGKTYFYCSGIGEKYDDNTKRGIYFLGENIATSTSFMEKDLYTLSVDEVTDAAGNKHKQSSIELKLDDRNFTISAAYNIVDKIEGIIYDKNKKELRYYSNDWESSVKEGFSTINQEKRLLLKNVSEFKISSSNGTTRIRFCIESGVTPGSFVAKSTTIKVCKTGVII